MLFTIHVLFPTFIPVVKLMFLCNIAVVVSFLGYCGISRLMCYFFGEVLPVPMSYFA